MLRKCGGWVNRASAHSLAAFPRHCRMHFSVKRFFDHEEK
jgi:hypothetical protein